VTTTYYLDADGDGFGDPASALDACAAPVGYVANGGDCLDTNADVHPGQTAFFTVDRGDGSFDYDCNGGETAAHPRSDSRLCICGVGGAVVGCSRSSGWAGAVPACGETAAWNAGGDGATCDPVVETATQGCR
jgi:hypothetical protein